MELDVIIFSTTIRKTKKINISELHEFSWLSNASIEIRAMQQHDDDDDGGERDRRDSFRMLI